MHSLCYCFKSSEVKLKCENGSQTIKQQFSVFLFFHIRLREITILASKGGGSRLCNIFSSFWRAYSK